MTSTVMILILLSIIITVFVWTHIRMSSELQKQLTDIKREWKDTVGQQTGWVNQQLEALHQNIQASLKDTRHTVQHDLKSSGELMANIHSRLGELREVSERIFDMGSSISDLQDLLKAPKIRGGLGEYLLEDLLSQILPQSCYHTQYQFKDGQIVDALIQLGSNRICIDSKFPLELFQHVQAAETEADEIRLKKDFIRSVKKHVDDISRKYILPLEGTYDFALMYIPAEKLYYEIINDDHGENNNNSLFSYAIKKRVIPVSPNSIYAYLQVILLGVKGYQLESKTKEVIERLAHLRLDFKRLESEFSTLGKHVSNSVKAYDKTQARFSKIGNFLHQIDIKEATITDSSAKPMPEVNPNIANQSSELQEIESTK